MLMLMQCKSIYARLTPRVLHLSLLIIITCAIKEWWFAPHMVEHTLSHLLTLRLLSLQSNGDHGSDTT